MSYKYYGVKEANLMCSFLEFKWLTPYETLNWLNIHNLNNFALHRHDINLHPNELILSSNESTAHVIDVLLLAKQVDAKSNTIKLKSILLSNLVNMLLEQEANEREENQTGTTTNHLFILSMPKDSFVWSPVKHVHLLPKFALRLGYDQNVRQFSYVGRMRVASLFDRSTNATNGDMSSANLRHIINLIGTLTHYYESIPAIVLQLHDLSYLNDKKFNQQQQYSVTSGNLMQSSQQHQNEVFSLWSKLRNAMLNGKTNEIHFNLISGNYEVLCLRQQPATLKQLCVVKLIRIDEAESLYENCANNNVRNSLRHLPKSIRSMVWPSHLKPGECLVKYGKMRSMNDMYEMNINEFGAMRFVKYFADSNTKQCVTFEKNVECVLISKFGVYILFDNNQAMRRPRILYEFKSNNASILMHSSPSSSNVLANLANTNFLLELSDSGHLKCHLNRKYLKNHVDSDYLCVNILNLNDYFISPSTMPTACDCFSFISTSSKYSASSQTAFCASNSNTSSNMLQPEQETTSNTTLNLYVHFKFVENLKLISLKLFNFVLEMFKNLFQNIRNRQVPVLN